MSQTTTINGTKTQSQTLDHVYSYPLVKDISTMYEQNPIGAKSIELSKSAYSRFGEPAIPYLRKPWSFVAPYAEKADEIGDSTLSTVDNRFPAVKKVDLAGLRDRVGAIIGWPFHATADAAHYVIDTYNDEYKKIGGENLVTTAKAIVSTELRIASEGLHALGDWLGPKKDAAEQEFEKVKKAAEQRYDQAVRGVQQKKDEAVNN